MQNKSVEEKIEDYIKNKLTELGLKYYTKTETINSDIEKALKEFPSKSGGLGINRPDIKLLIDDIPIMIEVKGRFEDLVKRNIGLNGLELDMSSTAITKYACNGSIHYAHAILTYTNYDKVIAIGAAGNTVYNGQVNDRTSIWSYLVTREQVILLKDVSNKNDLSYLINLKEVVKNVKKET